jgi:hypothetical protein
MTASDARFFRRLGAVNLLMAMASLGPTSFPGWSLIFTVLLWASAEWRDATHPDDGQLKRG